MAESRARPTTAQPDEGWSADQMKAYIDLVKQHLDEKVTEMRRAVDVAREGEPPHVTLQYHLEALLREHEKQVTLALTSADKLEQERIARTADRTMFERELSELRATMSDTAILKAEGAADKQFGELKQQVLRELNDVRMAVQELTRRVDTGLGG